MKRNPLRGGKRALPAKDQSAGAGSARDRVPRYLSRAILIAAALALLSPIFVRNEFYYPFIFYKSILFRTTVQVMTCLYFVLAAQSPAYRPRLNRLSWAAVAYFAVMFISCLPGVSAGPWRSWFGDFARMGGMITQLHLFAYFLILTQTAKRGSEWVFLFTASLFSGTLMGLTGLIQKMKLDYIYRFARPHEVMGWDPGRIMGATGNPVWFASLMALNFFIAFWFLLRRDKKDVYPVIAKSCLGLTIGFDVLLLIMDIAGQGLDGGLIVSGLSLLPVAVFALILHGIALFWFLLRGNVHVGSGVLALLSLCFCYWIFQSQTRSAFVGAIGFLGVIALFYLMGGRSRILKSATAGLLLCAVLLASFIFVNRQASWIQKFPPLTRLTSVQLWEVTGRLSAWKAGTQAVLDHPVFGWGLENYKLAFDMHFPPGLYKGTYSELWFDRAHNFVLDIATTTGLLGLAAYLTLYGLLLFFLRRIWLQTRDIASGPFLAGILLGNLFQNLFTFETVNTEPVVFLLLAYICYLPSLERTGLEPAFSGPAPGRSALRGWLAAAAAAALLIPAHWHAVRKPYASNLLLNSALAREKAIEPGRREAEFAFREDVLDSFRAASDYQTTGRHQVREEFANYAIQLGRSPGVALSDKVRAIRMAADLALESILQDPRNARRHMYLATLVNNSTEILMRSDPTLARSLLEKAVDMTSQAERLSPTRPQVYFEKGQALGSLGRFEEAAAALKRGAELSPAMKEPRMDLVVMCVLAGRYADAASELQAMKKSGFALVPDDYSRLIDAYNEKKQYAATAGLYREQLESAPNDPFLLAHLATAYRAMGELDKAGETAKKAASLSPEVARELKEFLNSLGKRPK